MLKARLKEVAAAATAANARTPLPASLAVSLVAGGDMRIWPDPKTHRNKYGTATEPRPGEISFASTTASTISEAGFAAAASALERLFTGEEPPHHWFGAIRSEIAAHLGTPNTQVVLAASGTDAELVTLALARSLARRPLTNIFIAPDETGKGVPQAAAGRHFSETTALGDDVAAGRPIAGLGGDAVEVRAIAIRDASGVPRSSAVVDCDVAAAVETELRRGRDVLLHVLDCSKTGLAGPTRETARLLAAYAKDRITIVVDACQLRCTPADIRRDLEDGFMVAVTGSKFAAGPPFSGAVLLPPAIAERLAAEASLPAGLSDYSARLDWPDELSGPAGAMLAKDANIGLGLRWVAALEHIRAVAKIERTIRTAILEQFAAEVRARAVYTPGIALDARDVGIETIIPLTVTRSDGSLASEEEAKLRLLALRAPERGPICHIGQPVGLGTRTVLRVAASAPDVIEAATALARGADLDAAMAPLAARLDIMFTKLAQLA